MTLENKPPPDNYSSDKKYERKGACTNCGVCCFGCKCQLLTVKGNKLDGDKLELGVDIISQCSCYNDELSADYLDRYIARGCKDFPHHPLSTPALCGYYWVEVS